VTFPLPIIQAEEFAETAFSNWAKPATTEPITGSRAILVAAPVSLKFPPTAATAWSIPVSNAMDKPVANRIAPGKIREILVRAAPAMLLTIAFLPPAETALWTRVKIATEGPAAT
jgi:hypothetical protein